MLEKKRIAQTVIKLQQAGKRMPQEIRANCDRQQEAVRILGETVDLWHSIFSTQNIGAERWDRAETIALTLSGAQGLNVNVISPALMQEALKQAEAEHVQANISRNNEYKNESLGAMLTPRVNAQLWHWTAAKRHERREIMPYMPTESMVQQYGRSIGLSDIAIARGRMLLRCYLNDYAYSQSTGKPCASKLLIDPAGQTLTLQVVDTE